MARWREPGAVPLPSLVPEFLRYGSMNPQHRQDESGSWETRDSVNLSTQRTLLYGTARGGEPTAYFQGQQRFTCPDGEAKNMCKLQLMCVWLLISRARASCSCERDYEPADTPCQQHQSWTFWCPSSAATARRACHAAGSSPHSDSSVCQASGTALAPAALT